MGSSEHQQIQQLTTLPSSLSESSLVIYDLNPDRRRTSLAEERRRLLNACRLFGIPIALDVQTVPENGGIGICEPVSLVLQAYSCLTMHSYQQRCSRNWTTRRYPTSRAISDCKQHHLIILHAAHGFLAFCYSNLLPHSHMTLSYLRDKLQTAPCTRPRLLPALRGVRLMFIRELRSKRHLRFMTSSQSSVRTSLKKLIVSSDSSKTRAKRT